MSQMTAGEIKRLFNSCSLDVVHLDQGQLPIHGNHEVPLIGFLVACETDDCPTLLSSMQAVLMKHLHKLKRKTRLAYTYGGEFFTNSTGRFFLYVDIAVVLKD